MKIQIRLKFILEFIICNFYLGTLEIFAKWIFKCKQIVRNLIWRSLFFDREWASELFWENLFSGEKSKLSNNEIENPSKVFDFVCKYF